MNKNLVMNLTGGVQRSHALDMEPLNRHGRGAIDEKQAMKRIKLSFFAIFNFIVFVCLLFANYRWRWYRTAGCRHSGSMESADFRFLPVSVSKLIFNVKKGKKLDYERLSSFLCPRVNSRIIFVNKFPKKRGKFKISFY